MAAHMDCERFFRDIRGRMAEYGTYARLLQPVVGGKDKAGQTAASQAFTDCDRIVQEGLLEHFLHLPYHFSVFGEEETPYATLFQDDLAMLVTIDPIDGTLAYKNQLPHYAMIVAVFNEGRIDGALVHTPADGKFYGATQERPLAWQWTPTGAQQFAEQDLWITRQPDAPVFSYRLSAQQAATLQSAGFALCQYDKGQMHRTLSSILRGELIGFLSTRASSIDFVPVGFITRKAGGMMTDYAGSAHAPETCPLDQVHSGDKPRIPSILVSSDKDTHKKLLEIVRAWC